MVVYSIECKREEEAIFCPKCRYEYRPEVFRCPTCDVYLVKELPIDSDELAEVESPAENIDWVQIARLNSQQYAEMFLEILQKKEIPAVVHSGAGHFGITGQMGTSTFRPIGGGYSLYVDRDFVKDVDREGALFFGDEWDKLKLIDIN